MQLRGWVRGPVTVVSFIAVVVLALNIESTATYFGLDKVLVGLVQDPTAKPPITPSPMVVFITHPATIWAAALLAAFTVGMWADTLLRRIDTKRPSRAEKLKGIGSRCVGLHSTLKEKLIYNDSDLIGALPRILSVSLDLEKAGFPVPRPKAALTEEYATQIARYMDVVGTLIRDGHFKEARQLAGTLAQEINTRLNA
jgi:hypothetical protein